MHIRKCLILKEPSVHPISSLLWASLLGPNGSKPWSSCGPHDLLTYCVYNNQDLNSNIWGYSCQNWIFNLALRKASGEPLCTQDAVCLCACQSVCEKRATEKSKASMGPHSVPLHRCHKYCSQLHTYTHSSTLHDLYKDKTGLLLHLQSLLFREV